MSRKKAGKLFIATSGWLYKDWGEKFYPSDLPDREKLIFYAKHFATNEINSSFYHEPRESTYDRWREITPDYFIFSVKVNRLITRFKRLKGVKVIWRRFVTRAVRLEHKLGPLLLQFPPSFAATPQTRKRLIAFLEHTLTLNKKFSAVRLRLAFEFRHPSWCTNETYDVLKQYNAAWVISQSSRFPADEVVTADFIYIRFHGPGALFSSNYSQTELKEWAKKIVRRQKQGLDIFAYFNNDNYGYAIDNAFTLLKLTNKK
jgi:uncharacterized protein YecE (DUF72 family)